VSEQGCLALITLEEKYPDITRKVVKFMQKEIIDNIMLLRDKTCNIPSICLNIDVLSIQETSFYDQETQAEISSRQYVRRGSSAIRVLPAITNV